MIKQVSCEKYLLHNDDTEEKKSKKEKPHYIWSQLENSAIFFKF